MRTSVSTLIAAASLVAPASALDNPVMISVHATAGATANASATLFEHDGDHVLVNVTAQDVPNNVAITLNGGSCSEPGRVAFALSPMGGEASLTTIKHSLADIVGKAKSLVVHRTPSETSPPLACGELHS